MSKAFEAWKKKYASNIAGLANSNDTAGNYGKGPVDTSVGTDMLISNLKGTTNYKGGGALDFKQASAELQQAYAQDDANRNKGGGGGGGGRVDNSVQRAADEQARVQKAALDAELAQQKLDGDANRSAAYVNSRIGAIGNNEMLAMQGLAGNMYGNPASGMSETSRVNQDVALGNNLNAVNQQQSQMGTQARTAFATNNANNQMEMAKYIANMQLQRDQMAQSGSQFQANLGLSQQQMGQNQSQFDQNQQAAIVNQQMQILQQLNAGKITRTQANIMLKKLGLPTI